MAIVGTGNIWPPELYDASSKDLQSSAETTDVFANTSTSAMGELINKTITTPRTNWRTDSRVIIVFDTFKIIVLLRRVDRNTAMTRLLRDSAPQSVLLEALAAIAMNIGNCALQFGTWVNAPRTSIQYRRVDRVDTCGVSRQVARRPSIPDDWVARLR